MGPRISLYHHWRLTVQTLMNQAVWVPSVSSIKWSLYTTLTLHIYFILHTRYLSPAASLMSDRWLGIPFTESRSTAAVMARLRRQTTFISADTDIYCWHGRGELLYIYQRGRHMWMKTDSFSGIPNTKYLFNNMIFKLNLLNRTVVCGVKVFFSKIWMSRLSRYT